jgi:glycerol-3-phosphate dehydrogenase
LTGQSETFSVTAGCVIFTAGEGNAALRQNAGLDAEAMQVRPLHMVMVRGELPALFGHCIDGNKTRATITSNTDSAGRTVWLVGGEIAEKGVEMDETALAGFAREELRRVLPGVDFKSTQWATYRINRAEGRASGNRRPEGVVWRREGAVITAWPTKLVLAPQLAREIAESLTFPPLGSASAFPDYWPRPDAAQPPWEIEREWIS